MTFLKELHLIARTIYTFVAVLVLSAITGLSITGNLMLSLGTLIFLNSFMFQYFVLHWALKNFVTTQRGRAWFLLAWMMIVAIGIIVTSMMIPTVREIFDSPDPDALMRQAVGWGSLFAALSSALVAATCARRSFTQHGAL
jgi:hypothetical protein